VEAGQAKVMAERCVACGNCVRVCTQKAKKIWDGLSGCRDLLAGPEPVLAVLAPSFPAAFAHLRPLQVVSALRRSGFA